ncbi:MAG: cohesin domain-containing protein [bacterium]
MRSFLRSIRCFLISSLFVSSGFGQAPLDVSPPATFDVGPPAGSTISIPLTLTNDGGQVVDAVTFQFNFPTTYLTFVGVDRAGTLTENWNQMDGQENTPGVITLVGFNSVDGNDANQTGVLVNVQFTTTGRTGQGVLQLTNLQDDLVPPATTTDGTLTSTFPVDLSPPLSVEAGPPSGQTVSIPLTLTNDGGAVVDAVTFQFLYPTAQLTYVGVDRVGTLTENWNQMDGQENTSGTITFVGFNSLDANDANQTGVLVNVQFVTTAQSGTGALQLINFQDAIAHATTIDGTLNGSVPVELASFSARVFENAVALEWLTISETNNFGFDVERSTDGESFTRIAFVQGNGTTTEEHRYEFTDEDVEPGSYTYRLKQIDFDGAFEYSSRLKVELNAPSEFRLAQNYPNPFNPETAIQFSVPVAGRVQVIIYNSLGRAVRELVNSEYAPGTHSVTWDGRDDSGQAAASGIYLYTVKAGQFTQTRKMILAK